MFVYSGDVYATMQITFLMLVSHCGEYPCECKKNIFAASSPDSVEWAYECNSPPIAMIARYSKVSVSIRGRSCRVANSMLLSHCGEYLANVKHLYSRHIRQK